MNSVLDAISIAGTFNSYKFKPSKCKVVGFDLNNGTDYKLGGKLIKRADCGLLLGAVIDGRGISKVEHVIRRAKMVRRPLS